MSLSRADLNKAFREAASYEFREIPRKDALIQYEFSVGFEQRMEALLKKEKKLSWRVFNTGAKRVAVIAAVIAMLATTACAVPSIRESIVSFVKEVFDIGMDYTYDNSGPEIIETNYYPSYIPSGFSKVSENLDEGYTRVDFEDEDGNLLYFVQTTEDTILTVDTEHTQHQVVHVNGCEVDLHINEADNQNRNIVFAIWIEDSCFFKVLSYGTMDEQELLKIVAGMEPVE